MMSTKAKAGLIALVLVVSCGISAGAAWVTQGWRWEAKMATLMKEHAEEAQKASDDALADYKRMEDLKDEAVKAHKDEADARKAERAAAASATSKLRQQLKDADKRAETATATALREYTRVSNAVFGECTEEYTAVADDAQRNESDARALLRAWPKGAP